MDTQLKFIWWSFSGFIISLSDGCTPHVLSRVWNNLASKCFAFLSCENAHWRFSRFKPCAWCVWPQSLDLRASVMSMCLTEWWLMTCLIALGVYRRVTWDPKAAARVSRLRTQGLCWAVTAQVTNIVRPPIPLTWSCDHRCLFELVRVRPFLCFCVWHPCFMKKTQPQLHSWVVTEFHWPTKEDHLAHIEDIECRGGSAIAECADASAPAHEALESNLHYLQAHGAKIAENVNGYKAAIWLRHNVGVRLCQTTSVIWGSPHMELADGTYSQPRAGAAACEKANVFESLCHQFPQSFVLVLYAGHRVDPVQMSPGSQEAVMAMPAILRSVPGGRKYYPRCSRGSIRANGEAPVQALVRVP